MCPRSVHWNRGLIRRAAESSAGESSDLGPMKESCPIALESVSFSYEGNERPVMRDLSLRFRKGEVTAILGRTGAGKTTMIYTLGGVIPNYIKGDFRGDVTIDGLNTRDNALYEIAQHAGLVMDDPEAHIVSFTVWEDVAFGPCNLGLPEDDIRQRIEFSLKATRLDGMRERNPYNLSGGEKQSLTIAGLLAMRPSILVLDEPTSMLDPLGRERVREILKALNEKYNITIVLSDYDCERIVGLAQRLIVLDEGQVVLDGPCRAVMQNIEALEKAGVHAPDVTRVAADLKRRGLWTDDLPLDVQEALDGMGKLMSKRLPRLHPITIEPTERANGRQPLVHVERLSHVYPGGVEALANISLDIYPGEYVALIGQNGSGKTTLAKHMSALLRPSNRDARIIVGGLDLRRSSQSKVARKVGYVFQIPEHQIFCATVREEIGFGLRNLGMSDDQAGPIVERFIDKIELRGHEDDLLFSLNRGKKFRVVLASVLAMDPELVIVDEPTTGQDWNDSVHVCEILNDLRNQGKTIIMITHEMSLVASFSTRVLAMYQGRVLLDGPPKEVFSRPEALKKTWVQPPQTARLSQSLGKYGLPPDMLTSEELSRYIATSLRGAN